MHVTEQMLNHHHVRTVNHILSFYKYVKLYDALLIEDHDLDKLKEPLLTPYSIISWFYKMKREGTPFEMDGETKKLTQEATYAHVKNNQHHPEFWDDSTTIDCINLDNRDSSSTKMVDATKMPDIDIIHMVCDWCAVAEERGTKVKDWANSNINKRWKFTDRQVKFLYSVIEELG